MDINEALLRKKHEVFTYELKPGTTSSFYILEGTRNILPERIGFSKDGFLPITQKGRAITEKKVGQIVGNFKLKEESPYKQFKPFALFSSIWEAKNYPMFIGYGDIGISNPEGKIRSNKDLFIIYSSCKGIIEIHLFKGLVEFKESILAYLKSNILKRTQALERA